MLFGHIVICSRGHSRKSLPGWKPILRYADKVSCSKTQNLVLAAIELPLSGLIQQTTKKKKKKKKKKEKKSLFLLLSRKQDLTFHTLETICMKCKSCFLGRKGKYFKMSSVENFTQNVKRYGLHKQIAHGSVHGKTDNKTCTKRRISLHISSLIRAFANRMYLLQSMGLTKRLVRRAKTRVNLRNCIF